MESKLTRSSNHVHLISWDWTLVFKRGSTPRIPKTTSSYETTTPRYKKCSRLLSGTFLYSHSPIIFPTLSQLSKLNILVPRTFFATTAHICTSMMRFDHDKFLPPFVKLSTSPYCTNISSQYNVSHYDDNAQHGAWYNSTERATLPGKHQCTHLSTVNVHNARPIGSAHFAEPMSYKSTYHSLSLLDLCNNSPASSTHIAS